MTYALQGVISSGTGSSASIYPWPAAGKTGSAQDNVDAWFCGYTVQLTTCVWVGYPEEQRPLINVEGVPVVYGGTIPAAIWRTFMQEAMAYGQEHWGYTAESFPDDFTLTGTLGAPNPVPSPTPPSPVADRASRPRARTRHPARTRAQRRADPERRPSPSEEPSPTP